MPSVFNKPVVQILISGCCLAAILLLVFDARMPGSEDKKVLISDTDVAQLIAGWQRTWNRMPTLEELEILLEILYTRRSCIA